MAWKPGRSKAQRALEDPYEDVPDHLFHPLWQWIDESVFEFHGHAGVRGDRLTETCVLLRLPLPEGTGRDQYKALAEACKDDRDFMLDLVEALLELYRWDGGHTFDLKDLLMSANSAYAVNEAGDGLELRVADGVKKAVGEVVATAPGSAGEHLVAAWNAAYGRKADPVKAYSDAIKAVEAALAPRVSPQNPKQTLGTMIRDVKAKPEKWTCVIADDEGEGVGTILAMMRTLWDGQTSRHGGPSLTRHETSEEARAAVHLAATLVQFGVSGAFDGV